MFAWKIPGKHIRLVFSNLGNLFALKEGGNKTCCCAKQAVRALGHALTGPQSTG